MRFKIFLLITASICLLSGCGKEPANTGFRSLEEIKSSGNLVVLTRNAPSTWYKDTTGKPTGPEYELVESFADYLGVKTEYRIKESIKDILADIESGHGDLAAAAITITSKRKKRFRFGPSYQEVTQQLVCRRDNVQPESIEELIGLNIKVIAASSYSERLNELKAVQPELTWTETTKLNTEQLLGEVWSGNIDCTVADSTIVDINRRYYPELIAPLNLSREQEIAWVVPGAQKALAKAMEKWLQQFVENDNLEQLDEKYYGFFKVFDYVDISTYIKRIDKRFPEYRHNFKQAAEKYDLPYILIAAQGYQESHWVADAKSPTGVRGIMMLTKLTANELGIKDRLNPKQSIFGGAEYLSKMRSSFDSKKTGEPDLTWLALAAYNIGRGHMHDAQTLARQLGKNPYLWNDMKEVLPLLSKKKYYKKLKYGYARGTEPVRYVQRIREYAHVMENEIDH